MDVDIEDGGGKWFATIYQVIFDTSNLDLYISLPNHRSGWIRVPLSKFF